MTSSSTDQHPVRPPKSPARTHHSSDHHHDEHDDGDSFRSPPQRSTMQAAVDNVSNVASQAYNRAPDLGFTQAAQGAYNRAPDLGIQSTISRFSGKNDDDDDDGNVQPTPQSDAASQGVQRPPKSGQRAKAAGAADDKEARAVDYHGQQRDLRQISRDRGPSSKDRLGKSQREIGTEYGIPTRAGAGTTASPDAKAKEAMSKGKNKPRQANVPQDYMAEPCPERNAGTGKADDIQRRYERKSSTTKSNGVSASSKDTNSRPKPSSGGGGGDQDKTQISNSSPSTSGSSDKRRSMGVRLRDQFRGELKILKGSLTNNHDTITRGISIKNGQTV